MTDLEKQKILDLRNEGKSYRKIAETLTISESTIKSFFVRKFEKNAVCKNCNSKLQILEKRKPKTFCSNNCRITFWRKNKKRCDIYANEPRAIRA